MTLEEALIFGETFLGDEAEDLPVILDAETIPGWVIALRPGRRPHVEIWWGEDFIQEMKIHQEMICERSVERVN